MFTRKQQQRLRRLLIVSTLALVMNLIVPAMAQAQLVDPSDEIGNSNPVIVQPTPIDQPGSINSPQAVPLTQLSSLPVPTEKPVIIAKQMVVRASAYSSTVDQCDGDPFTTASGAKVQDGIIAMNGIPFGTKIRIPDHYGDKVFTVTDRMNAKWGTTRIDIWMVSRTAAKQWGVRTVTIEILS